MTSYRSLSMARRALLVLAAALLLLLPAFALADDDGTDTAGNLFVTGGSGYETVMDLYGAGDEVLVSDSSIGGTAVLAGYKVGLDNCAVGGSVRAAGYDVALGRILVSKNITAAGYSVSFSGEAAGVYALGNIVKFSGSSKSLYAAGSTVYLLGVVDGDALIYANKVVIGENAAVSGRLRINASEEPAVPAGAAFGEYVFEKSVDEEAAAAASRGVKLLSSLRSLIMLVPGRILLAALYFLLIGGLLSEAAGMVKSRPAAMPVTGLIGLVTVPMVAFLLCLTFIGIPAGGLIGALYALCLIFSASFMGSVVGRLVFPKLHPLLAAIIGVTALTLLKIVPVLGTIIGVACMSYTLGFFLQKCYLKLKKTPAAPAAPATEPAAPVAAPEAPEAIPAPAAEAEAPSPSGDNA